MGVSARNRRPAGIALAATLALVAVTSVATHPHPSDRRVAPLLSGAHIDRHVRAAIERSCGDCHSDATSYPWYSYIAPVSWLIQRDVTRGRERLNLSRWDKYPLIRRERCLSEIANQVKDGEMPLAVYTLVRRDAVLSPAEREAIFAWTQAERQRLIFESINQPRRR
jgi:hypothetical protein